jgi:hypothetical protein
MGLTASSRKKNVVQEPNNQPWIGGIYWKETGCQGGQGSPRAVVETGCQGGQGSPRAVVEIGCQGGQRSPRPVVETGCQGGQGSPRAVAPSDEEESYLRNRPWRHMCMFHVRYKHRLYIYIYIYIKQQGYPCKRL